MVIKLWSDVELPVDVLLLTVEECDLLSCFIFLDDPFKSYSSFFDCVYFGSVESSDKEKLKIALVRYPRDSSSAGGSFIISKFARILRLKAVFFVGTCSGLKSVKSELGDVVVCSTLRTTAFKMPFSGVIGSAARHVADRWIAPLENLYEREVKVHYGDILSPPLADRFGWCHEDIIQVYPEAIAVATEVECKLL